jgi:hypothetical protein
MLLRRFRVGGDAVVVPPVMTTLRVYGVHVWENLAWRYDILLDGLQEL